MLGEPCMGEACVHWLPARINPDPTQPNVVEILWDCVFNHHYRAALIELRNSIDDEDRRLSRGVGLALEAWRAEKSLEKKP